MVISSSLFEGVWSNSLKVKTPFSLAKHQPHEKNMMAESIASSQVTDSLLTYKGNITDHINSVIIIMSMF